MFVMPPVSHRLYLRASLRSARSDGHGTGPGCDPRSISFLRTTCRRTIHCSTPETINRRAGRSASVRPRAGDFSRTCSIKDFSTKTSRARSYSTGLSRISRLRGEPLRILNLPCPDVFQRRSKATTSRRRVSFSYETVTDPISKKRDGWLVRCRQQNSCPKIMHWDSGTEPWQGRNWLVVTDPSTKKDAPIPDNVRLYYFTGTQHRPTDEPDRGMCQH